MNALALSGYASVDVREMRGPQMVTVSALQGIVARTFAGERRGWTAALDHIGSLRPLGVETVALKARRRQVLLFIGRAPESRLSVDEALLYRSGLEAWLRGFLEMLPRVKASPDERQRIEAGLAGLSSLVGVPLPTQAAAVLIALLEATTAGSCVTIHVVQRASPDYSQKWAKTDLTSVPALGIANRNWLWDVETGAVTAAAERNDMSARLPELSARRLAQQLAAVSG